MRAAGVILLLLAFAAPVRAQVAFDSLKVLPLDVITPLGGRIPGVVVFPAARPGSSGRVALRGRAVPAGRIGPLYLIDGIMAENGIEGLDPSEIDSVDVLKGAAAAALYGARAGEGVILIRTRRAARGGRLRVSVRSEAAATSLAGDWPTTTSTSLLTDETGTRFCYQDIGQRLCERTADWSRELARINNLPGDSLGTPVQLIGSALGIGLSLAGLANTYQSRDLPGPVFDDQASRLARSSLLSFASADAQLSTGATSVHAGISRLGDPGMMRFRDGYQRLAARIGAESRLGNRWSLSARAFGSTSESDAPEPFAGDRALFEAATALPAMADVMARDSIGRRYALVSLSSGNLAGNPAYVLEGSITDFTYDRFGVSARVNYAVNDWAELHAGAGVDRASAVRVSDFDFLGRGVSTGGGRTEAESNGFALEAGLLMRRRLGEQLHGVTRVGIEYHRQNEHARSEYPNLIETADFESKELGLVAATSVTWRGRYMIDGGLRRESFTFAGADHSELFGRLGLAWTASEEPWWFAPRAISRLTLRAARGSAGGRPNYPRLTEVPALSVFALGVPPSGRSTETEIGADLELFGRLGLTLVRASARTSDEPMLVPLPASQGFGFAWQPIGEITSGAWELALTVPVIRRRSVEWSWRLAWDNGSAEFGRLIVPPFNYGVPPSAYFVAREGERLGQFYGRRFVTSCAELPAGFQAACGDGRDFQRNDDGLIVYTGSGNTWRDGITRNLWGTQLAGAQAPWGVPLFWGAPITVRDTACLGAPNPNCAGLIGPLGNAIPETQIGVSTSLRVGRVSVFALVHGMLGREVWNAARHWSYLTMTNPDLDQRGRSVETAKPVGYYLRAGPADGFAGYGGLYDILAPNSHFVEDAGFLKLRELAVTLDLGRVGSAGEWSVSVTGRNLLTISGYGGLDPEVPVTLPGFGGYNAADNLAVPPARTFGLTLSAAF